MPRSPLPLQEPRTWWTRIHVHGTVDTVQATVQGNDTQTKHLQEWQDHAGNVLAWVDSAGGFHSNTIIHPFLLMGG